MIMKNIYKFSALLCACAFSFAACVEETLDVVTPANDGDEILFGARAGFENAGVGTKTVYSGETYTTEDGKTFERIDWDDAADWVQVYCPEAAGVNPSHYKVNHSLNPGEQKDFAYLTKDSDQETSLQWRGDKEHHFYAMYPSSKMFSEEQTTLAQGIKMSGTTLMGTVPGAQAPVSLTQNGNEWVAAPDMKYAYMAAKSTATIADGNVSLSFVPIVTAVEVTLTLSGENVQPVSIAEIQVVGDGIAGDFTADLSDEGWPATASYPVCNNEGEGTGSIQVSTWYNGNPITLTSGQSLTFTVFLRPGAEYKNLKVNVSPNGAAYVGKTMGTASSPLEIPQHLKTVIKGVKLPATQIELDASKWMSQLDGQMAMKKLSIPGTGGSFSYNYNSSNPGWYKQQTLDLDEQWAAGIRAFEIVSERPSSASTSLGTENVKCNKVSMGVTVLEVLKDLLAKVAVVPEGEQGPTECAVLILTYQPEGSGRARNASSYASSLKAMYDGLDGTQKSQIIQYTPDLTLDQAKGKVMIFCRLTQKDENDNGSFSAASETLAGTNITLIDGCGTGKDRWGSRGYKVKSTDASGNAVWSVAYDAANTSDAARSVDYYLMKSNSSSSFPDWNNVQKPDVSEANTLNFGFSTNYSNVTCWYQEWARVVPGELVDKTIGYYFVDNDASITDWFPTDYRWYESYTEKVAAAQKTFEMAISDNYPAYVFINSLCGYLVDSSIESSYTTFTGSNTGGIAGNIKALSDKLNPEFYKFVLEAGLEQTTGPTGIVMMDYVTNVPATGVDYDGSYLLPGVIISNNFKFGSGNAGNSGNSGNNNQQPGQGDNQQPGSGEEEEG